MTFEFFKKALKKSKNKNIVWLPKARKLIIGKIKTGNFEKWLFIIKFARFSISGIKKKLKTLIG